MWWQRSSLCLQVDQSLHNKSHRGSYSSHEQLNHILPEVPPPKQSQQWVNEITGQLEGGMFTLVTTSSNKSRNSRDWDKFAPNKIIDFTIPRNFPVLAWVELPSIFRTIVGCNRCFKWLQAASKTSPDMMLRRSRRVFSSYRWRKREGRNKQDWRRMMHWKYLLIELRWFDDSEDFPDQSPTIW